MIGKKIIYMDTLDSTNNYVANLEKENLIDHGAVILADSQVEGRGQRGASWDCEPFKNLTLSVFLKHDNLAVKQHFSLNQCISLAVLDFLNYFQSGFKIKWPNDIVFGNSKIAGILIENQISASGIKSSIVGLGININQIEFGNYNAISLKRICGANFNLREIIFVLIEKLNFWYRNLIIHNYESIKLSYLKEMWLYNVESDYTDISGDFKGTIKGVDELGQLLVEKKGSLTAYQNKEITFLQRKSL